SRADCESVSPDEHDSQKLVKVLGVKRLLPVSGAPLERTAAIAALTTGPSRLPYRSADSARKAWVEHRRDIRPPRHEPKPRLPDSPRAQGGHVQFSGIAAAGGEGRPQRSEVRSHQPRIESWHLALQVGGRDGWPADRELVTTHQRLHHRADKRRLPSDGLPPRAKHELWV